MSADQKNKNRTADERIIDLANSHAAEMAKFLSDQRALAARVAILEKRMQSLTPRALPGVPPTPAPSGPPNDANTDNTRPPRAA